MRGSVLGSGADERCAFCVDRGSSVFHVLGDSIVVPGHEEGLRHPRSDVPPLLTPGIIDNTLNNAMNGLYCIDSFGNPRLGPSGNHSLQGLRGSNLLKKFGEIEVVASSITRVSGLSLVRVGTLLSRLEIEGVTRRVG